MMILPSKIMVLILLFSMVVYSAPVTVPRGSTGSCSPWAVMNASPYELQSNLWGASGASGSQCTNLISFDGKYIAWSTTWSWQGNNSIKSFANIQLNAGIGKRLGAISSMQSTWKWSQSASSAVVADVAYDLFTSSSPNGRNENEVMVWLANYNAGPISDHYASSTATPIATGIKIEDHTWSLYEGNNGANKVFSFLPTSGTAIKNFDGDINQFLTYLTSKGYIASSQYLKTAQGGTEATSGTTEFTTSAYSLHIK